VRKTGISHGTGGKGGGGGNQEQGKKGKRGKRWELEKKTKSGSGGEHVCADVAGRRRGEGRRGEKGTVRSIEKARLERGKGSSNRATKHHAKNGRKATNDRDVQRERCGVNKRDA